MNSESEKNARVMLAESGRTYIEALGEAFIEERFDTNAQLPNNDTNTVHLERFTRTHFPRILLDPQQIDESPPIEQIKAVFKRLTNVVNETPDQFLSLFTSLNDPELFSEKAKELKLTEDDFLLETEGGAIWPLTVVIAALALTSTVQQGGGAPVAAPKCYAQQPGHSARFCTKNKGHAGRHFSPGWGSAPGVSW